MKHAFLSLQQRLLRTAGLTVSCATLLPPIPPGHVFAAETPPPSPAAPERIGVYDSRAIAVAYAGSEFQRQKLGALTAQLHQATQAGNTQEVARVKAEGQAWQAALHRQGFGTAPVDDLLSHLTNDLPAIQQSAGVGQLISRWNQTELDRHPKAARVDVTRQLVDAFRPSPEQRRRALQIQETPPRR